MGSRSSKANSLAKIVAESLDAKKTAPDGVTTVTTDAAPAPGEPLVDLVVWSVPVVNRMLIICHRAGEDGSNPMNLVSVNVRDNSNFLKKMAVRARRVSERKFTLEGPCPRWRGKW